MVVKELISRENYFGVLAYLDYQFKVMQNNPKTLKRKWAHLLHLLNWAGSKPFNNAQKIEPAFPHFLLTARNDKFSKPLSASSMQRACGEARSFFSWMKLSHPGIYKNVKPLWIMSLRPARANSVQSELIEREYYSLEEVRVLISLKPKRLIDRRDRAAVAMLFISGMRISAFVTLPISCVDLVNKSIKQLPSKGVKTKNSKAAITFLLPVDDLFQVVKEWDEFIRSKFDSESFWYPSLSTDGMDFLPEQKTGNSDSRRISFSKSLERFCVASGISYKSPHKLRNGHGVYAVKQAENIEDFKAYSQNMMHESMDIMDRLYGRLGGDDVKAVVTGKKRVISSDREAIFEEMLTWFEITKKAQNRG